MKLLFCFLFSSLVFADSSDCKYFKYCNSGGSGGGQSFSSPSASSSFNPAIVSRVKGLGLEALIEKHNATVFNFVSGTGKFGALISNNLESNFFGNRAIELENHAYIRNKMNKQYTSKKYGGALGASLLSSPLVDIDAALSGKYNSESKFLGVGGSISGRIGPLTFSAFLYQDDAYLNFQNEVNPYSGLLYSITYPTLKYHEKYWVSAYTLGSAFKKLTFDFGMIKSKTQFYGEESKIYIYSFAYRIHNKWLLNLAFRKEETPNLKYNRVLDVMMIQKKKSSNYLGVQYSLNKHFFMGMNYNYFLLNEYSFGLTYLL